MNALLLAALLAVPSFAEPQSPYLAPFARLEQDYWDAQMKLSPLYATFVNDPRYQDQLDDYGAAGRAEEHRLIEDLSKRLAAIDRASLSETDRVSWDVLKEQLAVTLLGEKQKLWQWNADHMDGPQSWVPTVIAMAQPMKDAPDAEKLLVRLKEVPTLFAQQTANLREGVAEGRVAARVPVQKLIAQLDGLLQTPAKDSAYLKALERLPADLRPKYQPLLVQAVQTHVYPAYRDYRRFLHDEYLPKSRATKIGLSALPGGRDAYLYEIRAQTTVEKTPEELHALGLSELEGIHKEMAAIQARAGFKGPLSSYLASVRKDPKNFFTTREQVLETARAIVARVKAKLPEEFGLLPKTDLEVRPIEDYKEKNDVAARYYQPPDDLSRNGIYFINTYEPTSRPRFSMNSLACHEGVPGHHLQIALALEQRGLPAFRRNAGFTAFVEGWALYSERLCDEMGMYTDDLARLGMLSDQALRAARLVVDTGIHALGWERQQAIDFMKANTPMGEDEIVAEVDRYTIWPGQALAYKVGQREIAALRAQSRAALGDRFDLRAFHDTVLRNGALPLSVLRGLVEERDRVYLAGAKERSASSKAGTP